MTRVGYKSVLGKIRIGEVRVSTRNNSEFSQIYTQKKVYNIMLIGEGDMDKGRSSLKKLIRTFDS